MMDFKKVVDNSLTKGASFPAVPSSVTNDTNVVDIATETDDKRMEDDTIQAVPSSVAVIGIRNTPGIL